MNTEKKGLLKPTIQVTLLSFANILLSFITQLVVAYYFGATPERDGYFAAMTFPTYVSAIIVGSIGFIFLPIYVDIGTLLGKEKANCFFRTVTFYSTIVSLIVVAVSVVFSKKIISIFVPGFEGKQLIFTTELLVILAPTIGFQVITNLAASVLQVQGRFLFSALAPILSAIITLVTVLCFSKSVGIRSLAFGTLAGSCFSCLSILFGMKRTVFTRPLFHGDNNKYLLRLVRASAPLFLTGIFFRLTGVFERGIASSLTTGSISYLGYANQIMLILATITSSGLAVTIFPLFSNAWTRHDMPKLIFYFHKCIRIIFLITVPVALIFIFWGDILIRLLFERGAFDQGTSRAVYRIFSVMTLAFISNCLGSVVVKIFYLSRKTVTASISELAGLLFYLIPAFILARMYGYMGMAVATSIGASLSILLSFVLTVRILKGFSVGKLLRDILKIFLGSSFACLVSFVSFRGLLLINIPILVALSLAICMVLVLYILFLRLFEVQEISNLKILYKTAYEKIVG